MSPLCVVYRSPQLRIHLEANVFLKELSAAKKEELKALLKARNLAPPLASERMNGCGGVHGLPPVLLSAAFSYCELIWRLDFASASPGWATRVLFSLPYLPYPMACPSCASCHSFSLCRRSSSEHLAEEAFNKGGALRAIMLVLVHHAMPPVRRGGWA